MRCLVFSAQISPFPVWIVAGSTSQTSAITSTSLLCASRDARATALPIMYVWRLAPACEASGARAVSLSPMTTCSGFTPISCAEICASTVRIPSPISVTPVTTFALPPSSISTQAAARSITAVRAMPYQHAAIPRPRLRAITLLRRFLFLGSRKARAQCTWRPNIGSVEIATRRATRRRRACVPSGGLFQRIKRTREADRTEFRLCVSHCAVAHRVDPPDQKRVEPESFGADIEMGFRCKCCLQGAKRSECAGWCIVGVDAKRIDPHVGDDIRPGRQNSRLAHDALGRQTVCTAVADHFHL